MSKLAEIHNEIGQLPEDLPKLYLLGSTGAGKTSIVQNILGTKEYKFPSVSQMRTTVAVTEYIIDSTLPYKTILLFKEKKEIINSIEEIVKSAISTVRKKGSSDIINKLKESSDQRFRLKYILDDSFLTSIANIIIENERLFQNFSEDIKLSEIDNSSDEVKLLTEKLSLDIFIEIEKKLSEICDVSYDNNNLIYSFIKEEKEVFIDETKKFLSNEKGSLSPLIKYARVEGNLLATWIPQDFKFILIDGEGIGHSLKDIGSELSVRHLDFFAISDAILLIEKGDDPFISGGNRAVKSIVINGYQDRLNLIFSKTDKIETDSLEFDLNEIKTKLSSNIANLENTLLEDEDIFVNIKEENLYYLSELHQDINTVSQIQIKELLQNVIDIVKKNEDEDDFEIEQSSLEYDFTTLLNYYDSNIFLEKWLNTLNREAWQTIKAFNTRMYWEEDEFRHLKPIADFHTLIMKNINMFLNRPAINELSDIDFEKSNNRIKQQFSQLLLSYIRELILLNHHQNWEDAYMLSGAGSTSVRRTYIKRIFEKVLPRKEEEREEFQKLLKEFLIDSCEVKEVTKLKSLFIKKITVNQLWKKYNIEWELDKQVNILIGKNGMGKSTLLQLIHDMNIIEKYNTKLIKIDYCKEYKNNMLLPLSKERKHEDINNIQNLQGLIYIDTFDGEQSDLNSILKELIYGESGFSTYQGRLEKIYKERIEEITNQMSEILNSGTNDDFVTLKKLNNEKDELYNQVYITLEKFEKIINELFQDTEKRLNLKDKNHPIIFQDANNEAIVYSQLSSGEKQILIILLTVLLNSDEPIILVLDEPEISLHVDWQRRLIDDLVILNPDMQIILATHSPAILTQGWMDKVVKISDIISKV